jgi:CRISPR-associated endonuclease Cas1
MLDETLSADALPPDSATAILTHIYNRPATDEHVAIGHGYNVRLRIIHGQLVLQDGIGRHQRERKWAKADRTLRRIVITGPDGYLTLEALAWCAEHAITVTTLTPDCELVGHYAVTDHVTDAKLLRRQVLAADTPTALEIARELLTRKVTGQADNLIKLINDMNTSGRLYHYASRMQESDAITQRHRDSASVSELEGWASRDYFATWVGKVTVPFEPKSLARIPPNWTYYPGRSSQIAGGGKKYNAADPINALLNYAYTLGYSEARTACIAHGLNPTLGFVHSDKAGRDSLALDILETIRPEIDAYILDLLGVGSEPRHFSYRDFAEPYGYEPGTVRLVAPLTHEIAEASYQWRKSASDAAQAVVNLLTGHAGKRGSAMPNWTVQKIAFTSQKITAAEVLTDADWQKILPLLPPKPERAAGRKGHPPIDNRVIIAAMIYCDRHHRPWAHVPESMSVSYRTMRERRREWQRSGHWPALAEVIDELASRPE